MLLVELKKKKNTRFCKKTPFFFFFKHSSFKSMKKNIKKRDLIGKKNLNSLFLITNKNKKISNTVLSDKKTISILKNSPVNFLPRSKCSMFSKKNTIFGFYSLISDCNIGSLFFKIYSTTNNSLLYNGSNGSFCELLSVDLNRFFSLVKLPSGFKKKITLTALGIKGRSNGVFFSKRFLEKVKVLVKKKVRGIAKNPVDHPNGGRSNTKKPFLNRFNKIAKKGK